VIYVIVVFLVMIVYTGQKHTTAKATLHSATRATIKTCGWTAVAVISMLGLTYFFID
jgi:hypothetical protein